MRRIRRWNPAAADIGKRASEEKAALMCNSECILIAILPVRNVKERKKSVTIRRVSNYPLSVGNSAGTIATTAVPAEL